MKNQREHQTTFVNSEGAPALESTAFEKSQRQAGKDFKLSTQPTTTGDSMFGKATDRSRKPTPSGLFAKSTHYTDGGLNIPLYDVRGKRITHARDGRVILHRLNKQAILNGIVKGYVGEAVAKTMENWSKNQIGDWITKVETQVFSNPPRGKTMKERDEENKKKAASSVGSLVVSPDGKRRMSLGVAMGIEEPQGRITRSLSEEMKAILDMGLDSPSLESSTPPSPTLEATSNKMEVPSGYLREQNLPSKKEKLGIMINVNSDVHKKRKPTSPPPAVPQQTPKRLKADLLQKSSYTLPTMSKDPAPKDWYTWNPAHVDLLPPRSTIHPSSTIISAFSLAPSWDPNPMIPTSKASPLCVLPLPSPQAHLLLLATASTRNRDATLYTLLLPHRDLSSQRKAAAQSKKIPPPHKRMKDALNPLREPYLKHGHHGYDWAEHRWRFAEDEDRRTGVGHQVDPADRRRLEDGDMSAEEFGQKYGGTRGRGGVWPCGCEVWAEEGESEEE